MKFNDAPAEHSLSSVDGPLMSVKFDGLEEITLDLKEPTCNIIQNGHNKNVE